MAQQKPFDFDDEPARPRYRPDAGTPWLSLFTAQLAAALVAGVILLLGVRLYVHWSLADTVRQMNMR